MAFFVCYPCTLFLLRYGGSFLMQSEIYTDGNNKDICDICDICVMQTGNNDKKYNYITRLLLSIMLIATCPSKGYSSMVKYIIIRKFQIAATSPAMPSSIESLATKRLTVIYRLHFHGTTNLT